MRKAWFCYEMGAKGPCPCIYYDDLPNEKNKLNRTVLQKHELVERYWFYKDADNADHDICSEEVCASFAELKETFPYTGKHYDIEALVAAE